MNPGAVRARIAALMLAPGAGVAGASATRVGGFVLRPAQVRALAAALAAVREFGGVLIADPPGSGKTVLALATARALLDEDVAHGIGADAPTGGDAAHVLVIAPATLRDQWYAAAERARIPVEFVSLESLSRGRSPRRARTLIVDEAHHARTPTTRRYARLAACCLGARVLLLSATPVVNRAADRDALLALFLGSRGTTISPRDVARCVLRMGEDARRPAVRRLGRIGRGVDVPGLADAIRSLPAPVPLADGAPAAALVAMSLAMAWRSSLAALDAALRRRIQRGTAVRDLLLAGQRPTHTLLRHWVMGDHATQLALGPLLDDSGPHDGSIALQAVIAHVDAVARIRALIRPYVEADAAARAGAVMATARSHPDRRIVVFARHAQTVRTLHAALRAEPGVVSIVGARVSAAAGRWTREEVLRAIGPRSRALRADDARAIRMVLATDVVAEGVEMHGVGIIIHADIPWTPARLEQRLGRLTRVGSEATEVMEAWFGPPPGASSLIRLGTRLRRKSDARRGSLREARAQAMIARTLHAWADSAGHHASEAAATEVAECARGARSGDACIGGAFADRDACIAVVGEPPEWLIGEHRGEGRWRMSSNPRAVARLLRAVSSEAWVPPATDVRSVERRIREAIARRTARQLARHGTTGSIAHAPPLAAQRRVALVRARFAALLARTPSLARAEVAARQATLLTRLGQPLELAREHRLDALLRDDLDDATFARRLGTLLLDAGPRTEKSRPSDPGRLRCLLILRAR